MSRLRQSILLALLLAGPAAAQPSPSQLVIQLWSYGYTPQPIHLRAGQPVTLNFVNSSGKSHDFTAREFFASSRIIAGGAPDGQVELGGHQSRSITLVPSRGVYRVHCSHFLHSTLGMTDSITVD